MQAAIHPDPLPLTQSSSRQPCDGRCAGEKNTTLNIEESLRQSYGWQRRESVGCDAGERKACKDGIDCKLADSLTLTLIMQAHHASSHPSTPIHSNLPNPHQTSQPYGGRRAGEKRTILNKEESLRQSHGWQRRESIGRLQCRRKKRKCIQRPHRPRAWLMKIKCPLSASKKMRRGPCFIQGSFIRAHLMSFVRGGNYAPPRYACIRCFL